MMGKSELHRLIDELSEQSVARARRMLAALVADESLTDQELLAVAEAEEDVSMGRTQSLRDLRRELGLEG